MNVACALTAAIGLDRRVRPPKTELVLPSECDHGDLSLPRDVSGMPLPDVVTGFKAYLGVPRHPTNDPSFIDDVLGPMNSRLDLVAFVSDEDPFGALRLLHVCGVNRFGHVLSAVPPGVTTTFCGQRDAAVSSALSAIQGFPVDRTQSTHTLPVAA